MIGDNANEANQVSLISRLFILFQSFSGAIKLTTELLKAVKNILYLIHFELFFLSNYCQRIIQF